MEIKNIRVKEDVWWKLNKLKVELRIKSISELIEKLVKENELK
jgi:predicted CopG family antitoxin